MGIEALLQQLAEGKLTKEQFAAEIQKMLDAGTITQEQFAEATQKAAEAQTTPPGSGGALTEEQIMKMIQSATDKVRTEYSTKLKTAESELDKLKTDKMTAEEKAEHERQKLADAQAELLKEKVNFHTLKTLAAKNLPQQFDSFLAGSTIEDTDSRIAAFEAAWQTALQTAVDEKFKQAGGTPREGRQGGSGATKNPWKPGPDFNLTEQGKIFREDPEKARKMAAEYGMKI